MKGETDSTGPQQAPGASEAVRPSNWAGQRYRSGNGTPMLPAEVVAGLGPGVRLIEIRDPHDFIGPLGYIPGSEWIPPEELETLPGRLGNDAPVVVVSQHGERASEVARMLERRGMTQVAALAGGVSQWLSLGFGTTRDPEILDRCDVLHPIEVPELGEGLPIEQVEAHIGDPSSVRWIKLAALVLHAQLSCIDGRGDRGIVGTPGGDAGQFLLALAAIESVLGRRLESEVIDALLGRRIDALGGFYMHTDHQARSAALAAMRGDPRLADVFAEDRDPSEWRQFLRRPPLADREAVLEHLCRPDTVGCGHIRLMLQHGDEYRLRPGLVRDVLRSFFHARWEGAFRAEYESLHGRHDERAVLNSRIEGELYPFTPIPLVSPSSLGSQMFVNHPQVAQYLVELLVDCLLLQTDLVPEFEKDLRPALLQEIATLSDVHVKYSLGYLARGLPVYDVVFSSGGEFRVEARGTVG